METQIVLKGEDGAVLSVLVDGVKDKIDGYLEARKKFGEIRFSHRLEPDEHLELIVDGDIKMRHPMQKTKKKSRSAKKENLTPKAKSAPVTAIVTTEKKSPLKSEELIAEEDPVKAEKGVRLVVEQSGEAEEEWEPEESLESDAEDKIEETKRIVAKNARDWSTWNEALVKPSQAERLGDKFNEAFEPCLEIREISFLSISSIAQRFREQGLALLDNAKFCLPPHQLEVLSIRIRDHYRKKLNEAEQQGLTSKKKPHRLAKGNEEAVPGFNQRPGGRVDMVLDELDLDIQWPWLNVARAILGTDVSLNYVGVVVARPGDSNQNWHIDGVHIDLKHHKDPDRIIVFCPLTDLDKDTGCTEMIPGSHFLRSEHAQFHTVSNFSRARHYLPAGTPLAMDYRLWHRGLKNSSQNDRFLLYTVFERASRKRRLENTARGNLSKFIRSATTDITS